VTAKEKTQIARMARAAGMSMGEFLRRAAASFRPSEGEKVLEAMIDQMAKSTAQANAAIDEALAFVEASNKRISTLEARRKGA
jgi:mobilization protein NikA